jgi:molybdopterin biosynthesis enzyme
MLSSMAAANALAVVPEDVPGIAAGQEVDCIVLD